jgi:hypothetical protein
MSNNYVYYTALINNDGSSVPAYESEVEPDFVFMENRKVALLPNPEEYMVAVQSCMIDLKTLPVFIPTIKYNTNPTDTQKTETIYEITLVYNTYSATSPIYFQPQDQTITLPNHVNGKANYKSGYYNLYNYEFFFTMVNTAIQTAFLKLIEVVKSYYGGTLPTDFSDLSTNGNYEIPYFIFDKESSLIFLNSPKSTFSDSNSSHINIMLNKALYRLFNSLPFKIQNHTFNTLDADDTTQITTNKTLFKLNLSNFKQSNQVEIYPFMSNGDSGSTKTTHLLIYQDYETLSTWSPVQSIVIISPNFPIQSNPVSADLDYINGFPIVLGDVRYENEIMEISSTSPVPRIIYDPTEYRFMSMKNTDSGLTNIIFKIYYRFKNDGSLIQVKANLGGSLSLKLMFRKIK